MCIYLGSPKRHPTLGLVIVAIGGVRGDNRQLLRTTGAKANGKLKALRRAKALAPLCGEIQKRISGHATSCIKSEPKENLNANPNCRKKNSGDIELIMKKNGSGTDPGRARARMAAEAAPPGKAGEGAELRQGHRVSCMTAGGSATSREAGERIRIRPLRGHAQVVTPFHLS